MPIIKNDKDNLNDEDKANLKEILSYLKIYINQNGYSSINISLREKNKNFFNSLKITNKNGKFFVHRFIAYVLKNIEIDDFNNMSYTKSSTAYTFLIKNYDKRLNVPLINKDKEYLYIKFAFITKLNKKDKELLKLDKTAAKIKGVNIAPKNYNLLFLDTEKTIIDVVSFHDSD